LGLQLAFHPFNMQGMKNNNDNKINLASGYAVGFDEHNLPAGCAIADCVLGEYGSIIVYGECDTKSGSYGFNTETGDDICNPDFWIVGGIYNS
jgi:hypothetical protein